MELIIFILACLGASNIIVFAEIFEKPRNFIDRKFKYSMLNKLLKCTTCVGFWVGLFLSLIFKNFELNFFIGGLVSAFSNMLYSKIDNLW